MQHLITTGCSFTAGMIPLPHDTKDEYLIKGSVWPHFCFAEMLVPGKDILTNLAMPGGGNIAAMANLILWLEKHKDTIFPDNTMIGFNITELNRWDVPCDPNNPNANKDFACVDPKGLVHPSDDLNMAWITYSVRWPDRNLSNIDVMSSLAILNCFHYLEFRGFRYFFMLMTDKIYSYSPLFLQQAFQERKKQWINFDGESGMFEFAKSKNQTTNDGHPSIDCHKLIAKYILDFLQTNDPS
jgi:hypothetical protein